MRLKLVRVTDHSRRSVLTAGVAAMAAIAGCTTDATRSEQASESTTQADGPATYPTDPTAFADARPVETADGRTLYQPRSVTVYDSLPYSEYSTGPGPGDWEYRAVDRVEPVEQRRVAVVRMQQTNMAPGADYCPSLGTTVGVRLPDGSELGFVPVLRVVPVSDAGDTPRDTHAHPPGEHTGYSLDQSDTDQVDPETAIDAWGVALVPSDTAADEIYPAFGSESAENGLAAYWKNGYDVEVETDA